MLRESANSCFQEGETRSVRKAHQREVYLGDAVFHNFLSHQVRFVADQEFLDVIRRVALDFFQPHPHVFKRF